MIHLRFEFKDERGTVWQPQAQDLFVIEAAQELAHTSEDVLVSGEQNLSAWFEMLKRRKNLLAPVRLHACPDELEALALWHFRVLLF